MSKYTIQVKLRLSSEQIERIELIRECEGFPSRHSTLLAIVDKGLDQFSVDIVARRLVQLALEQAMSSGVVGHEDFADIGAHDWNRIAKTAEDMVDIVAPEGQMFSDAYKQLSAKAGE